MNPRVKNKDANTENSTYNFRGFEDCLKPTCGIPDYLEEELLIITSIKISRPNIGCIFKIN